MGGIYIRCGSFEGRDKSGSALDGVLADLIPRANPRELESIARIQANLEVACDHIFIDSAEAGELLGLLHAYRESIEKAIAPVTDPYSLMEIDEKVLDPTEAKYGAGIGWRYYCAVDLEAAFVTSIKETTPVLLTWI